MSTNTAGILDKVEQDRRRGDHQKALKRLEEGIRKLPGEILLYREAIDVALEAGESRRSSQLFKSAQRRVPGAFEELWIFGKEKVAAYNDPVLCKSMLGTAIKKRDLEAAEDLLDSLKDHTIDDLLKRTRNKKQSLDVVGGQMFRSELTVNTLAEALLCIRSKRFQDGARSFVQVLDDKPVEHQILTPYLATLQKQHPKRGGICYALGCSCLASEEWEKGIDKILAGVSLAPANADDAYERVEALQDITAVPAVKVKLALAKLKILKGDEHEAADMLRALLKNSEGKAPEILDLLETHVDGENDVPVLDYLYIETAMTANKSDLMLRHIKHIQRDRRRRSELLEWLDAKSRERHLATDILACYGQMLLEQQMYDRAIEIFRELLSKEPHQTSSVREALAPHRRNATIKNFYDEIADPTTDDTSLEDDGFSIEHFGNRDFSLDSHRIDSDRPSDDAASKTFDEAETPDEPDKFDQGKFERERELDLEELEAELLFEDNGADVDEEVLDEEIADHLGVSQHTWVQEDTPDEDMEMSDHAETSEDAGTPDEIDASTDAEWDDEELGTAQETEDTQEASFEDIHVASGEPILLGISDVPQEEGDDDETVDNVPDFASRFASFENGDLDNNEIIDLVEEAARSGRMPAMKKLLEFRPDNLAQEIERKYYLAEYYLHDDQPLSALIILRTVNINGLSKEQRKAFLLRYAYCYQQLNRFDAAQSTYLRIMSEYPEFSAAEHMANVCYQRYLQSSASRGAVLEKVGSLGTPDKEEEDLQK
jgi:tetratricopeptide (TPR) repeat protein